MFCPQQMQLQYNADLYQYTIQHNKIVPSIAELSGGGGSSSNDDGDDDDNIATHPTFEHDWIVNQVGLCDYLCMCRIIIIDFIAANDSSHA